MSRTVEKIKRRVPDRQRARPFLTEEGGQIYQKAVPIVSVNKHRSYTVWKSQ